TLDYRRRIWGFTANVAIEILSHKETVNLAVPCGIII
ncbi:hypothetical protein A2U01_0066844, partial [Trifolium medium]|nr:hypothetical protein [Trifolium medium]